MRKATLVLPILLLFALSAPARDKYKVTRLGTLGGSLTDVLAINSFGQITGDSSIAGDSFVHAFLYTAGRMKDLGTPGMNSAGEDINDSAQVVGISYLDNDEHSFLYSKGVMTDLGLLGGSMSSNCIRFVFCSPIW
jgi:probable HAF family extracellular repeat protein